MRARAAGPKRRDREFAFIRWSIVSRAHRASGGSRMHGRLDAVAKTVTAAAKREQAAPRPAA
eukprot:3294993-Pyramimonas_sp.AAC.1